MKQVWNQMTVLPLENIGRYTLFMGQSVKRIFWPPVHPQLLFKQMEFVGNQSLGICMIAAVMIGAVFGLILGDIFQTFGAASMIGAAAGAALTKEIAPVFCGFLVSARAVSSMAAEISTMRVNEQIDAMRVMAVNPYSYLVAPRIAASFLMLPLLNIIFVICGVISAVFMGILFYDMDIGTGMEKMRWIVKVRFLFEGLIKATVFGALIASIGCYTGFHAKGGAKGVGKATTQAVVLSLVTILVTDFFLTYFMSEHV